MYQCIILGNEIGTCLEFLLKQRQNDIEILVINDGSTDSSESVIKSYQEKYPDAITYYAKQNSGVADTRNYGIEKAKGKYILFVDSDDYIEKDLFAHLASYMDQDIDIIKFKMQKVDKNKNILEKIDGPTFEIENGQKAFQKLAFLDVLIDSPCIYAFKKELFTNNHLQFMKGTEHEDFGLIPLVILKANSVVSIPVYGYYYVQRSDSIIRNADYEKTKKKMNDLLLHYDHMLKAIEHESYQKQVKKDVKTYYTNAILLKLKELKMEDRKQAIAEIKSRKMLQNIQIHNIKQLLKKVILYINVDWYLKLK